MTLPGPKPMPRNLRVVRGMDAKIPTAGAAPVPEPPVKIPTAPDFLTPDEQDVFVYMARKLAAMRVMTEMDVELLAIFCKNWVLWKNCWRRLDAAGPLGAIAQTKNGNVIEHPLHSIAKKAQATCTKILIEFGMSPSARNRVSA